MMTDMVDELVDLLVSLIQVMETESEKLALLGRCEGLAELAEAKRRLVNQIEGGVAALNRRYVNWQNDICDERRRQVADILSELNKAARVNVDVLERQIELSGDMLTAVTHEMQRLTGRRSEFYCPAGMISLREGNAPLSVNYRL